MGHFRRSKDELISDVLLWTPIHGYVKVGQPARTYLHQLCADRGCSLEDLLEAMDDRDGWGERESENWCFYERQVLKSRVGCDSSSQSRLGCDTRSIFKQSKAYLNSEFCFSYNGCLKKVEWFSFPYCVLIAGRRTDGFMPFPSDTPTVLSRIWTWDSDSISYDNKSNAKPTS